MDIGTTSTKATIFTESGRFVSSHSIEYPIIHPKPDWAEQDPSVIYLAVLNSIRSAIIKADIHGTQLIGIGISSAMHSLIAVDQEGELLTNSIIWADNRSIDYVRKLKEDLNGHQIYMRTGTPIHPMSPLSKLLWMKGERPDIFAKAAKWISIKEYITWKWFHTYFVDYSIASTTGLFNLNELEWDQDVLTLLGIDKEKLSQPVPTTAVYQGMDRDAADFMGIPADIPIVAGASDGVLANLGVGAIEEGELAVTIGTSGAIRTVVSQPLTDPEGRTFCYALSEDKWVIGGPVNNGGIALRWFKDQFVSYENAIPTEKDSFEALIDSASDIPAGAQGLLFLPYLTGERAPHWNADARGVFFGISLAHQKEHFVRSVMEGVAYAVYSVGKVLNSLAGSSKVIRVSGGFARSDIWRQIVADVFDESVVVPESHESSGLGAAVLTLYALGHIDSLEKVKEMVHVSAVQNAISENAAIYRELFGVYERVYKNLEEEFKIIAEFQRRRDNSIS
ncbi:gluconate kinase [Peribacillus saganii]|uniref:Gluconate kinase n=1 Tax=Peribacillus saganii TaxID=2303992 RepID=A0A372LP21_9BACI|nr:gluconate kinase [Peribacillus saganii]